MRVLACALGIALTPLESLAIDYGTYGNAWLPWLGRNQGLLDFVIYQAQLDNTRLRPEIVAALASNVDVLVRLQIYTADSQRAAEQAAPPMPTVADYTERSSALIEPLRGLGILGITLDEENVYWSGRAEFLGSVYHELKSNFPETTIFQWYSSSQTPNVPGKSWPNLPADGWIVNQYLMPGQVYQDYIAEMGKATPRLISVVWASPQWVPGMGDGQERSETWWNRTGWRLFYEQMAVNLRHGVDTAFFMFSLEPQAVPLWDSRDACVQRFLAAFVGTTLPHLKQARSLPMRVSERPAWLPAYCD